MKARVVGSFETVGLPDFGINGILAKVDTGAFSGAIHCTDIKVVHRGKDREKRLVFTPLGKPSKTTEVTEFYRTYVRSATGHRVRRYIIDTRIEIKGVVYPIRIGLSDRSDMKKAVLIGKRFLRENNLLVDVRINQDLDDEGETSR